ncbi:MAG: hypothetical protein EPN97_18895 [Alphaproteobacteria bacterium]|nr:MAG: hypothetical protein EPN97_18895 [Alphaproteobacteria bacterium]
MDKIRSLRLDGIYMPVNVEHAAMNIGAEGRVIDQYPSRVDTLAFDVEVRYRGAELRRGSHDGVFDYMGLYQRLCFQPVRTLHGPLETILDEVADAIEVQVEKDNLALLNTTVKVHRLGLLVGAPELQKRRMYDAGPSLPRGNYRSAGVTDVPLQVRVDHEWTAETEYISRERNLFPETVQMSFSAITPAQPLKPDSLDGLYNYIKTYKVADAAQGRVVDGPFEILAEEILSNVLIDAAALKPAMISVGITRSGYARCRPTLGVELWP